MTYRVLLTPVSVLLNIQVNVAGGIESAEQLRVTLYPVGAAIGPYTEMFWGPTATWSNKIMINAINKILIPWVYTLFKSKGNIQ